MTDEDVEAPGAGDQGMTIGNACNKTEELLPLTIALVHWLMRQLAEARRNRELPWCASTARPR